MYLPFNSSAAMKMGRCGRTKVLLQETETGRLPQNRGERKEGDKSDKETMKEGLSICCV